MSRRPGTVIEIFGHPNCDQTCCRTKLAPRTSALGCSSPHVYHRVRSWLVQRPRWRDEHSQLIRADPLVSCTVLSCIPAAFSSLLRFPSRPCQQEQHLTC